jgi:hypothetical protein
MKVKSYKSIILFELLISIIIMSIITIYTLNFSFILYEQNTKNINLNISKMDFESTKLFLQENNFSNITLVNNKLLYKNNLLLNKVTKFTYTTQNNLIFIDICIKRKYEVCKKWVLN